MPDYLTREIEAVKIAPVSPAYRASCMTRDGYTRRSGAPTDYMIQIVGDPRWRRVWVWCTSNAGTPFIRTPRGPEIVPSEVLG